MSKECKCICEEIAAIYDPYKIYMKFGKSPGRYRRCTKMCLNCNYWTNDHFYKENKCFCCGNKYRHRKNMNLLDILAREWLNFLRNEETKEEQTEEQNNTIIIYNKNS